MQMPHLLNAFQNSNYSHEEDVKECSDEKILVHQTCKLAVTLHLWIQAIMLRCEGKPCFQMINLSHGNTPSKPGVLLANRLSMDYLRWFVFCKGTAYFCTQQHSGEQRPLLDCLALFAVCIPHKELVFGSDLPLV